MNHGALWQEVLCRITSILTKDYWQHSAVQISHHILSLPICDLKWKSIASPHPFYRMNSFGQFKIACNYSFAICFHDYCPYFSTRNNQDQKPVGFLKFLSRKLPSILFAISTNLLVGIENKIISSGTKFLAIVSISPIIHFGFS
jgi:hypothetical protein